MRNLIALTTALLLSISCSAGADEKPAISTKTRAAEITVTLDRQLQSDPTLAANLMAEGKRYVEKSRADAEAQYKDMRDFFKDGRRFSYDLVFSFRSLVADRYVSLLRDDGTYTGGAHPNSRTDTILWDKAQKKRISVRPFFNETSDNGPTMKAIASLVQRAVEAEKLDRANDSQSDDVKKTPRLSLDEALAKDEEVKGAITPKLLGVGPISLAPSTEQGKSSGLTFHFSAYDVDAYAAGPYTVFVPWTALKPFLSAEGTAIFGGVRPKSDEEQN